MFLILIRDLEVIYEGVGDLVMRISEDLDKSFVTWEQVHGKDGTCLLPQGVNIPS